MSSTVAFWGVSMLLALTPGADWAYAISSGLRRGGVLPAVSGLLTGHLTATLIVAAGVAAIVTGSDVAMTVLSIVGALYLIWLGAAALRRPTAGGVHRDDVPLGHGRLFVKGVGISLLNPKVFLLFLALLPGFTSATGHLSVGVQMMLLGILHVANCALVYFAVGFGSATVLTRRPRAARIVCIASAVVMIALGIILIVEKGLELA